MSSINLQGMAVGVTHWIGRVMKPALLAQCLSFLLAGPSAATDFIDPSVSTCTGDLCSSIIIHGTVVNRPDGQHAWIGSFYEGEDECIYFSLVGPDPETDDGGGVRVTFVSPGGSFVDAHDFFNDDFPFTVSYHNVPGFWTVLVQNLLPDHLEDLDFTLRYARYPDVPRCSL